MNMNLKIVDVIIIVYFFFKCHADVFYLETYIHTCTCTHVCTHTCTTYVPHMCTHMYVMCTSSYMRSKESVLCVKHVCILNREGTVLLLLLLYILVLVHVTCALVPH